MLAILIVNPRACRVREGASSTRSNCLNRLLSFRCLLGRLGTLGGGFDASNAKSEKVKGLRARLLERRGDGGLPLTRREDRAGGICPKLGMKFQEV